jgi:hypothetical protein
VLPKLQILKSHLELLAGPKYAYSIDLPFIASLLTWPGEENKTFISFNESEVEPSHSFHSFAKLCQILHLFLIYIIQNRIAHISNIKLTSNFSSNGFRCVKIRFNPLS